MVALRKGRREFKRASEKLRFLIDYRVKDDAGSTPAGGAKATGKNSAKKMLVGENEKEDEEDVEADGAEVAEEGSSGGERVVPIGYIQSCFREKVYS